MVAIFHKENISEEYYKTILHASIDGFWIADLEGHFLEINGSYCQMIGYTRDELLKMKISDVEAIEEPTETKQRIEKIIKTGRLFSILRACGVSRAVAAGTIAETSQKTNNQPVDLYFLNTQ